MTDHRLVLPATRLPALLEGRMTQYRVPLTEKNTLFNGGEWTDLEKDQVWDWDGAWVDKGPSPAGNPGPYLKLPWKSGHPAFEGTIHRVYPKMQVGDRLWVAETWGQIEGHNGPQEGRCLYRVDARDNSGQRWLTVTPGDPEKEVLWSPAITMPRWASRLTLTVIDVRVQRVREISGEDCIAEGIPIVNHCFGETRDALADLWNTTHGPDAWDRNDYVCAITFDVHRCNIDQMGGE